jgi:hypothetical protein
MPKSIWIVTVGVTEGRIVDCVLKEGTTEEQAQAYLKSQKKKCMPNVNLQIEEVDLVDPEEECDDH